MNFQTADQLRAAFLDFFTGKGHTVLPSASLVPIDDPTLLWINSGVATLKPYFSGQQIPPNPRLANSQKSIRTNDIENVGRTARHHTLFEMLGNFSIGEYFKQEAIVWAYEFLVDRVGFAPERVWISVHPEDDEALTIWRDTVGVPVERIVKLTDNFWDIGPGPCGPNSEIYYDRGPEYGCGSEACAPGCDCERYLEVWNLVFSQFNHNEDGTYTPLPRKNIDTGMGLERLASIVQDVPTNYGTDLFTPYIRHLEALSGRHYADHKMAMNVIADHVRAVTLAVADGAVPTNEGRGYVIRRLLRRAVRFGGRLGFKRPFLCDMVPLVVKVMGTALPELHSATEFVQRIVQREEERFLETLDAGTDLFMEAARAVVARGETVLGGEEAFRLYDTFGFPLDLTEDLAREHNLLVDTEGFARAMEAQRQRARAARSEIEGEFGKVNHFASLPPTDFTGHTVSETTTEVVGLLYEGLPVAELVAGQRGAVLCARTPFYAESGGQSGDMGTIHTLGGSFVVEDTQKYFGDFVVHLGHVSAGALLQGETVTATIDTSRRLGLARAHTATHILHAVLKNLLGNHVQQSGSLVEVDRLRFDFAHFAPLGASEIVAIEAMVNAHILADARVSDAVMSLEAAKSSGATALFGEKYGQKVRVVSMGDLSRELCGGTHLQATAAVGLFLITGESSVGAGLRRLEAVTGQQAYAFVRERFATLDAVAELLKTKPEEVERRTENMLEQNRELTRDTERLYAKLAAVEALDMVSSAQTVADVRVVSRQVGAKDIESLRAAADAVRDRLGSGVVVLGAVHADKVALIGMVTDDLVRRGLHAGNLLREVAKMTDGSGGGKPTMAQAGGKDPSRLPHALSAVANLVAAQLKM